jgi:ketosteroid isomerase-like protein
MKQHASLPLEELGMFSHYLQTTLSRAALGLVRQRPSNLGFCLVEHACHLRDYEALGVQERIRKMLAEGTPSLSSFPGEQMSIERDYRSQNMSSALADFILLRSQTIALLHSLSEEQLQRTAHFGDEGMIDVTRLIGMVVEHDRAHRQEIEELLAELYPQSSASDHAALRQMARDFADWFNAGEVDRLMSYYGQVYVDQNLREPVQSHAERRAYYERLVRQDNMRLAVYPDEIIVRDHLALIRGRIELTRKDAGIESSTIELRYLEVATKTGNEWKSMWGMDGPVQD